MPGFFSRLFKIGQAQAHSIVDKFENPIKLTEQGIRDLKQSLQETMKALAEVKALAIRLGKDAESQKKAAEDYERKAMLLLQKAQNGSLEMEDAERLARDALARKEDATAKAAEFLSQSQQQQELAGQLQNKVNNLKTQISKFENELISLKARARTANATRKINQQLSNLDASGTVQMLERMRTKVTEQEALAEAYGEMATPEPTVDEEINKALESGTTPAVEDSLAKLKQRLGIQAKSE